MNRSKGRTPPPRGRAGSSRIHAQKVHAPKAWRRSSHKESANQSSAKQQKPRNDGNRTGEKMNVAALVRYHVITINIPWLYGTYEPPQVAQDKTR